MALFATLSVYKSACHREQITYYSWRIIGANLRPIQIYFYLKKLKVGN